MTQGWEKEVKRHIKAVIIFWKKEKKTEERLVSDMTHNLSLNRVHDNLASASKYSYFMTAMLNK